MRGPFNLRPKRENGGEAMTKYLANVKTSDGRAHIMVDRVIEC